MEFAAYLLPLTDRQLSARIHNFMTLRKIIYFVDYTTAQLTVKYLVQLIRITLLAGVNAEIEALLGYSIDQ